MSDKINIVVLFGGQSSEHEVSRVSAQSVLENLNKDKYNIFAVGITKNGRWLRYKGDYSIIGSGEWEGQALAELQESVPTGIPRNCCTEGTLTGFIETLACCPKIDVVFPVLHGVNGEDGSVQGLLELAGIPYVGCNILSSAVGMDKAVSKILFERAGLTQANFILVKRPDIEKNIIKIQRDVEEKIGYPCFVKPSNAGSSVGISKVKKPEDLMDALQLAGRYDRKILIEEFVDGREMECAVLGFDEPIASIVGEIVPCNEFYDYKAKYIDGDSEIIIPAKLDEKTAETIRACALSAYRALDCSGLARVDFFVEKNTEKVNINEINTMPGFTSISMYPKLWAASGIPYDELLDRLVDLAFTRFRESQKLFEREP